MKCQRMKGTEIAKVHFRLLFLALLLFAVSETALGQPWNQGKQGFHGVRQEEGLQNTFPGQSWGQASDRKYGQQFTKQNNQNYQFLPNGPAGEQPEQTAYQHQQQPVNQQRWEQKQHEGMQEPDYAKKWENLNREKEPDTRQELGHSQRARMEDARIQDGFDSQTEKHTEESAYRNGWETKQRQRREEELPTRSPHSEMSPYLQQQHTQQDVHPFTSPADPTAVPIRREVDGSDEIGRILELRTEAVTFVASNKTAEIINKTDWTNGGQLNHPVQLSSEFNSSHLLLRGSYMNPNDTLLPSQGLVHTVLTAYKDHHNLILKPDDIWIAILVQFSRFVNANAEELRAQFVSHSGTETVSFEMNTLSGNGENLTREEWRRILNSLRRKLEERVNPAMSAFVKNNFSTSRDKERIASAAVFLSTMQHFFKYEFRALCGIPQITILGNESDWEEIGRRVDFLRRFGEVPGKWADLLGPIIDQFVRAKRGDIDGEFWGDIVRIQKNSLCAGRTGVSEVKEDVLDGWLTAFAVFDGQGKWRGDKFGDWKWPRINMKHVSAGVVTVPITLKSWGVNGIMVSQEGMIFAGHMGFVVKNGNSLSPYIGWGVAKREVKPSPVDTPEDDYQNVP